MKLEKKTGADGPYWTVLLAKGELVTANHKTLPYSTWIGTVDAKGVTLWRPSGGCIPRDYKPAALKLLEQARAQLVESGELSADLHNTP